MDHRFAYQITHHNVIDKYEVNRMLQLILIDFFFESKMIFQADVII